MDENTPEISSLSSLKSFLFTRNLTKRTGYISQVPQICKDNLCVMGVIEDERGPDLGPLVVGLVFCPLVKTEVLQKFKTDNLSELTREDQEHMYIELFRNSDKMGFAFDIIPSDIMPDYINKRAKILVKEIAIKACTDLILNVIDKGVNIISIYVNTAAPPKKYEKNLTEILDNVFIISQNDDSAHSVLAAASICSRVTKYNVLQVMKLRKRSYNSASEYQKHRAALQMLENNPSTSTSTSSTSTQSQGKDNDEDENSSKGPPKKKMKL